MALINEYICCEYYGLFGTFFDSLPIDDGELVFSPETNINITGLPKPIIWYAQELGNSSATQNISNKKQICRLTIKA